MEVGIITKAATFESFLHLSYKQTLTDDFWGLHKNMNCAFPLTIQSKFINFFFIRKFLGKY